MLGLVPMLLLLAACSGGEAPNPGQATEAGGGSTAGAPAGGSTVTPTGGSSSGGTSAMAGVGGASGGVGATGGIAGDSAGATGGSSGGAAAGGATGGANGGSINAGAAGDATSSGGVMATGGASGGAAGAAGSGGSPSGGSAGSAGTAGAGGAGSTRPARVLLYSFSTLDIPSVPAQLMIFKQKLEGWQYEVDESEDPAVFTDTNLENYAAVGMINTCFYPFGANQSGEPEAQALQTFLQDGGGLFGTHCADVTFQSVNPPHLYNQLIGGRASSQNFDGDSACSATADHPTTAGLPASFTFSGNLDATDFIAPDSVVLVRCTWETGTDVAVSWARNEGPGRVFYTNFGKVDADLTSPTIGDAHILSGLAWVLGL